MPPKPRAHAGTSETLIIAGWLGCALLVAPGCTNSVPEVSRPPGETVLSGQARRCGSGPPDPCATAAEPAAIVEARTAAGIQRLNRYRLMDGLEAVVESPDLSQAAVLHARYLVKNRIAVLSAEMHAEQPTNGWYSPEGYFAGTGNVIPASPFNIVASQAIDSFISEPFQRLPLLDPDEREVGYGSYSEAGAYAVTLVLTNKRQSRVGDLSQYLSQESLAEPRMPAPLNEAIEFPPHKSIVDLLSFSGGEWPNPLSSCPGYTFPTGLPITLQLGPGVSSGVAAHQLEEDGHPREHCLFNGDSYDNSDSFERSVVRDRLSAYGAIVMIPRYPLRQGSRYTVSIVAGGVIYEWSFTTRPLITAARTRGNRSR